MSEDQTGLQAGLGLVSGVFKELIAESQEIMKMNPVNSWVMLDLFCNLGYAMLVEPKDIGGYKVYIFGGVNFDTRQDMVADVFRMVGHKLEDLLTAESVSQVFSFKLDLGKIAAALGGAAG